MQWVTEHASEVGAVFSAFAGLWAFAKFLHRGVLAHLSTEFATKQDIKAVETKLDSILRYLWAERMRHHERQDNSAERS